MKRLIFATLAAAVLISLTGCISAHSGRPWACNAGSCTQAPENCASCTGPADCSCSGPADNCQEPCQEEVCRACKGQGCHLCRRQGAGEDEGFTPGPPVGTVTYPYYTTRGPRDYLARNPPSIGP